jgi:hypothetical protein
MMPAAALADSKVRLIHATIRNLILRGNPAGFASPACGR